MASLARPHVKCQSLCHSWKPLPCHARVARDKKFTEPNFSLSMSPTCTRSRNKLHKNKDVFCDPSLSSRCALQLEFIGN